jgi:hypothetical protein
MPRQESLLMKTQAWETIQRARFLRCRPIRLPTRPQRKC